MPISPSATPQPPAATAAALAVPRDVPRPPEGDDAEGGGGISPGQVLHALRRRWVVALPFAAVVAAAVYFIGDSRLIPVYTARTLIRTDAPQGILYDDIGVRTDGSNPQRTHLATVRSRAVREAALRELEPQSLATVRTKSDPLGWLEKEIQADYTVAPEILKVSLKGSDPDELRLILDTVREAYLAEVVKNDNSKRLTRLNGLRELAAKHEGALRALRQKTAARAETFGVRDLPALRLKYEYTVNRLYALQTELQQTRLEVERLEALSRPAAGGGGPADAGEIEAALDAALAADPAADLRKSVAQLEKTVLDYERRLLNYQADPDYKRLAAELGQARLALADRRAALRPAVAEQVRGARRTRPIAPPGPAGPVSLPGATADRPVVASRQQIAVLETEIRRKEQEVAGLAKGIAELDQVRAEAANEEEQLNLIKGKMRPIEVELQAPPRASVIENATIVETPAGNRALKMAVAPAAVSFVAAVLLVAWLDLRRGQVNGRSDLEEARVRVLSALPAVRPHVLPAFHPPEHAGDRQEYLRLTDALDVARTVIAPALAATRGYTLVVTSAVAGEGKTVLSAHLAARLARSGLRTLLVDTDVRRPRLAHLLGLPPGPGLGEWVVGRARKSQIVAPGPVPGLDVIRAGGCDDRAVCERLDRRLPELLAAARRHYDVIVLDTPPVLRTAEALAVSRLADGVVLAAMRDVTRLTDVQECLEQLASVSARVLGAVVTGEQTGRYGY